MSGGGPHLDGLKLALFSHPTKGIDLPVEFGNAMKPPGHLLRHISGQTRRIKVAPRPWPPDLLHSHRIVPHPLHPETYLHGSFLHPFIAANVEAIRLPGADVPVHPSAYSIDLTSPWRVHKCGRHCQDIMALRYDVMVPEGTIVKTSWLMAVLTRSSTEGVPGRIQRGHVRPCIG